MNVMDVSVSTRQASAMLGVHESSVKRWCNAEELACWLTPGGHRRIPVLALAAFAQEQGIDLPLSHFGEDAGRVWAGLERAHREDAFADLIDFTYTSVAEGRQDVPGRLIEYLDAEGFALGRILDRLVGPVMRRIGLGYVQGTVSIGDEHRMTQTVRDALVTLHATDDPTRNPNGKVRPVAVVGCTRGEVHELGALMTRLVLEAEGWRVIYLGLDVPTEEFATQQSKHAAALVCVSMMPPSGMAEAHTLVRFLDQMYDAAHPYHRAIGGSALTANDDLDRAGLSIPEVQLFNRMEPFMTWARALAA